jgi:hypothetical protein
LSDLNLLLIFLIMINFFVENALLSHRPIVNVKPETRQLLAEVAFTAVQTSASHAALMRAVQNRVQELSADARAYVPADVMNILESIDFEQSGATSSMAAPPSEFMFSSSSSSSSMSSSSASASASSSTSAINIVYHPENIDAVYPIGAVNGIRLSNHSKAGSWHKAGTTTSSAARAVSTVTSPSRRKPTGHQWLLDNGVPITSDRVNGSERRLIRMLWILSGRVSTSASSSSSSSSVSVSDLASDESRITKVACAVCCCVALMYDKAQDSFSFIS